MSEDFLKEVSNFRVFAFKGEMGVGKTTFISYLAQAMGVKEQVSSPTYGYVKSYYSKKYGVIHHFDLYRIEDERAAYDIGIEEYLTQKDWVFIEWAEHIEKLLPEDCVWVDMQRRNDDARVIEIRL